MLEISIPGFADLKLNHIVFDYNGTLACDGQLLPGVKEALTDLSDYLEIHILTADTFSKAAQNLKNLPCKLTILPKQNQATAKADFVKNLSSNSTAAVGNGRNDRLMLKESSIKSETRNTVAFLFITLVIILTPSAPTFSAASTGKLS